MLARLCICLAIVLGVARPAFPQCTTSVEPVNVPIVTHWSNATQSFSFGAFDAPPFMTATPPWPYTWGPNFLPDYNNYITSSAFWIPQATCSRSFSTMCPASRSCTVWS